MSRRPDQGTGRVATLVGLTGPVSVARRRSPGCAPMRCRRCGSRYVSTDGFLLPNPRLDARGIAMKKGFPDRSTRRAQRFYSPMRAPASRRCGRAVRPSDLRHPARRRVFVERGRRVGRGRLNALAARPHRRRTTCLCTSTPTTWIIEWCCARLAELIRDAKNERCRSTPCSPTVPDEQIRHFAESAWHGINAVNLEEHIRPARDSGAGGDREDADHSIRRVTRRRPLERSRRILPRRRAAADRRTRPSAGIL